MSVDDFRPAPRLAVTALKQCPWCRGPLAFTPKFPVRDIIPGQSRIFDERDIPEELRTVAAWVCETSLCKYRETA